MVQLEAGQTHRTFGQKAISIGSFVALLEILDLMIFAMMGVISGWVRFGIVDFTGSRGLVVILAVLLCLFSFRLFKSHDGAILASPFLQIRRVTIAILFVCMVTVSIGYITKTSEEFSRLWAILWLFSSWGTLVLTRPLVSFAYKKLETIGSFGQNFVIFGTSDEFDRLEQFLDRWVEFMPASDRILGIFVDDPETANLKAFSHSDMIAGSFDSFLAWNVTQKVDRAVVVLPSNDSNLVEPLLEKLRAISINVDLTVGQLDRKWATRQVGKLAGVPTVRILTEPLNGTQHILKRLEDVVFAIGAMLLLWPLLLLVAVSIRLDSPGPIIFRQRRHGFNNNTFEVLKFRTMRHEPETSAGVAQARRNDLRVTQIGRILRKSSIDELPQLFNVLLGDMSIVGPRPHAVEHNDFYADEIASYLARHRIKPGITGWAQVNGYRGETEIVEKMQKRVDYDLFYADNWSLRFDLKIIFLTIGCLAHPNAY